MGNNASFARTVGNNEYPVASMWSADGGSGDAIPLRIIPERGQVTEDSPEPSVPQLRDVLHDDDSWSKVANDASEVRPEARARTGEARSFAGDGDVLAGEPSANDVDGNKASCADGANIIEPFCAWPMLR